MTEPGGVAPSPRPAQGDHTTGTGDGRGDPRRAAHSSSAPARARSSTSACWRRRRGRWRATSPPTLVDGRSPSKRDRHHLIAPLANRFRCADDRWIVLNMPEVRWWAPFCEAIGRPDVLEDPRFGTVRGAVRQHAGADRPARRGVRHPYRSPSGARIFDEAGLIWGPASTIAELASDPQAAAIELFPTVEHPDRSVPDGRRADPHRRCRHPPAGTRPGGRRAQHRGARRDRARRG